MIIFDNDIGVIESLRCLRHFRKDRNDAVAILIISRQTFVESISSDDDVLAGARKEPWLLEYFGVSDCPTRKPAAS